MSADIISRLEAAPEGSRELDRAIDLLSNPEAEVWSPDWWSGAKNDYLRWPDPTPGVAKYRRIKFYTTSVDAALTLVPEGCRWDVQQDRTCAFASVDGETTGRVATPALALCIAALKARG